MKPRIAVIGVGAFGRAHLRAYLPHDVDIVGVADLDPQVASDVASRYGIPYWSDNGFHLLDDLRPDGVSVVTAADGHIPLARQAIQQRCRVLLEKPVAAHSSELDNLPEGAEALVLPGHVLRFDPVHRSLFELVRDGAIGRPIGISTSRTRANWHMARYPNDHPALLTAIHDIDLATWMTGSRAETVSANAVSATGGSQPDLMYADVKASDGSLWSIRVSWTLPGNAAAADEIVVCGTAGVATVRVERGKTTLTSPSPHHRVRRQPTADTPGLAEEIEYFLRMVRERVPPRVVTLSEAAHVVRVAEAMIRSTHEGGREFTVEHTQRYTNTDADSSNG